MKPGPLPSQELLLEFLQYEPETGKLFWRRRARKHFATLRACNLWNTRFADKEAFSTARGFGYRSAAIFTRTYLAHRVIWKMVYGEDPDSIDHINGAKDDNRIVNLRSVTHTMNTRNACLSRRNKSGCPGVTWHSRDNKWNVNMRVDMVLHHIGMFLDLGEAIAARKAAEKEHGFHQNHGRTNWMYDDL